MQNLTNQTQFFKINKVGCKEKQSIKSCFYNQHNKSCIIDVCKNDKIYISLNRTKKLFPQNTLLIHKVNITHILFEKMSL